MTLALGIGSCQLPQPHLPKLTVASVRGTTPVAAAAAVAATPGAARVSVVAAAGSATPEPVGRT